MTLNDLKYFESVCTYKSISRAAEHLHISQPSLSVAIKGLEEEFGVALFERRHRGMLLTEEGEALLSRSRELLRDFDGIGEMMHDLGNKRSVLRIGVPPMIGSLLLPRICGEFMREHGEIRLDVCEAGSRELSRRLSDGQLDMVFLPHMDELPPELCSVSVASLEVMCCAARDDEICELRSVSPRELADRQLVLFSNSFYQTELIKRQFAECGVEPRIILETDQLSTAISIIESGVAVGFLFSELIERNSRLAMIPLDEPISVSVSLAYRRGAYMSEGMRRFSEFFKGR